MRCRWGSKGRSASPRKAPCHTRVSLLSSLHSYICPHSCVRLVDQMLVIFAVLEGCRYGQMMVSAIRLGSLLTLLPGTTIFAEFADNARADSTWPPSVGVILTDLAAMVSRAEMHVSSPDQITFEERRDTDNMNPDCWIRRSDRLSAGEVSPFSENKNRI